jgi:hypothetical protein
MSDLIRCAHCGHRKREHGAFDNPIRPFACPGDREPKWPSSITNELRAGEVYDRRLVEFWSERTTSFKERR